MAERKYQIFVSSTYEDLKEERTALLFAILRLNYIPAGMEFFTAIDEEQMEYIRRVIDESDYYVLILGARYGSLDSQGISYTEREYDYAVQQGKKVIALIHDSPKTFPFEKMDQDDARFKRFMAFREKVMSSGRLVSLWNTTSDLVAKFQASLIQTVQRFPAIGWMRGDVPANTETIQKIATLELVNQRLQESIKSIGGMQIATDIKMEACSVSNPIVFSETEIECVSLDIMVLKSQAPTRRFYDSILRDSDSGRLEQYYYEEAIPWFVRMARVCCFDLRITNPYPFSIKNMSAEHHLFNKDGLEIRIPYPTEIVTDRPYRPGLDNTGTMTRQMHIPSDLNPKQSLMFTHHRYYIPQNDQDLVYQRIISAENITEPIKKEIKVHYRVKHIEIPENGLVLQIQKLERQSKFNDAGVFEYVRDILSKEGKEQNSCDTQK